MDAPAGERVGLPAAGQPAALPSPSLSPVDSSLLGREPPAEAIARFGDSVIRIPAAAKPRNLNSQISTLNSFFRALSGTAAPRRFSGGWTPVRTGGGFQLLAARKAG